MFLRKEQMPRRPVKRKIPKLYITAKTNGMLKNQYCLDDVEHNMRIYNHEHLPIKPDVLVPTFQTKKDNIASNVVAYMKNYRPLINGQKDNLPKNIQSLLDEELTMLKQIEDIENQKRNNTNYSIEGHTLSASH